MGAWIYTYKIDIDILLYLYWYTECQSIYIQFLSNNVSFIVQIPSKNNCIALSVKQQMTISFCSVFWLKGTAAVDIKGIWMLYLYYALLLWLDLFLVNDMQNPLPWLKKLPNCGFVPKSFAMFWNEWKINIPICSLWYMVVKNS